MNRLPSSTPDRAIRRSFEDIVDSLGGALQRARLAWTVPRALDPVKCRTATLAANYHAERRDFFASAAAPPKIPQTGFRTEIRDNAARGTRIGFGGRGLRCGLRSRTRRLGPALQGQRHRRH